MTNDNQSEFAYLLRWLAMLAVMVGLIYLFI